MLKENETTCPKCGGNDFGTGKQSGYAKMNSGHFNLGSQLRKYKYFLTA